MLYHSRTEEKLGIMRERRLEENVYGHTDFGSLAPLVWQPITGLQLKSNTEMAR
jgi:hypothetical protein